MAFLVSVLFGLGAGNRFGRRGPKTPQKLHGDKINPDLNFPSKCCDVKRTVHEMVFCQKGLLREQNLVVLW